MQRLRLKRGFESKQNKTNEIKQQSYLDEPDEALL